ncbi:MAG: hypothetical protein ACKOZT_03695 [Cyanobium sp.]
MALIPRLPSPAALLGWGLGAALATAVAPAGAAGFDINRFNGLVNTFREYGFEVVGTHQRCVLEPNLFGLYLRGTRRIVICQRGNQLDTLMHEGWHAVQARCRKGAPLLTNEYLRANLPRTDLRDIDALYSPKSWHREAEARAMAMQAMPLYLSHLESSCGKPATAAGVAQPPTAAPGSAPAATAPAAAAPAAPAGPAPAPAAQSQSAPAAMPAPAAPGSFGTLPSPASTLQQLLPSLLR